MLSAFDTENDINPLVAPCLFDFDGLPGRGVGAHAQRVVRLAVGVVFKPGRGIIRRETFGGDGRDGR
ncbi:MAG TPA: hypothetical protein VF668_23200 [Pyrinomonadaceae bacterium]|jgi:hypothetical protein